MDSKEYLNKFVEGVEQMSRNKIADVYNKYGLSFRDSSDLYDRKRLSKDATKKF